jgi:hypothetical protein
MPRVTFYLRKEDTFKWKSIEHKTAFIHNCLAEIIVDKKNIPTTYDTFKDSSTLEPPIEKIKQTTKDSTWRFCTHGFRVGMCKHGCTK